ncbi:MAG: hypothetical protein NTZ05_13805 [Chloroflexi bacterium]|nr:hypothetical protein [Chloroflexota bacterium]
MMRDLPSFPSVDRGRIQVFRGEKRWSEPDYRFNPIDYITAATVRKSAGNPHLQRAYATILQGQIQAALIDANNGSIPARDHLETFLIAAQRKAFQNPYISCSFHRSAALSFALAKDTPGWVYTLEGDWGDGLDFQAVRARFGLKSDVFAYLEEFGIPIDLSTFRIVRVDYVTMTGMISAAVQVYP